MKTTANSQLGPVDILVNNAGIQFVAPADEFPVDELGKLTLFLCSEAGSSTTDASLSVDSGWTARLRGGLSRPTFRRNL